MNTIQFDLAEGVRLGLSPAHVAQKLIEHLKSQSHVALPRFRLGEVVQAQGGKFVGDLLTDDGDVRALFAAPESVGSFKWGGYGTKISGADSTWDGAANTQVLITAGEDYAAARAAAEYRSAGLDDWHLPAKRAMQIVQANQPGAYGKKVIWTSTQSGQYDAWAVYFEDGDVDPWDKGSEFEVVPLRSISYSSI